MKLCLDNNKVENICNVNFTTLVARGLAQNHASTEFWVLNSFSKKNPKQLSYKTPNVCQRPLFLLLTLWGFVVLNGKTSRREKDFPAERLRWVNKMLLGSSCKWNELLQILGLSSIHLVFSLQGGRGALTFWSVWLLALFFKSSTGKEDRVVRIFLESLDPRLSISTASK